MKKIIILAFVLLLGACSTKFAYNNINWLVYWYLDDYVELNDQQEEMFDDMLSSWMNWHQREELPKYENQISDIISDIKARNINAITIAGHRESIKNHWVRVRSHLAPDLVTLGASLSQEQVVYMLAKLETQNVDEEEEIEELSELDQQESIQKWLKRSQKSIKKWVGKLNSEQIKVIESYYDRFTYTRTHWVAYKRDYQQKLRETFALPTRDETFSQALFDVIVNPEQYRPPEFQQALDNNAQVSSEYIVALMELMSNKQLSHLLDEMSDIQNDVASLQK
jgi:hypothetical protein